MLAQLLLVAAGLVVLFKASDYLIEAAGRLAKMLGVSELVIGLTIVAVGTSIPEMASSLSASLQGSPGLALGNIIGSNISNIALVLGISALMGTVAVHKRVVKRDSLMLLLSSFLVLVVLFNGLVSWIEGILLIFLFVAYSAFIFRKRKNLAGYDFAGFVRYFLKMGYIEELTEKGAGALRSFLTGKGRKRAVELREIAIILIAGIAIVFSADLLIRGAIGIAGLLEIEEAFIGLTVVAIGTSLPELSVSLSAARKRKGDLMVGNIVGSNISNSLLVLGLAAVASPLALTAGFMKNAVFMCLFTVLFLLLIFRRARLGKAEGVLLLACYAAFLLFAYLV